MVDDSLLVATFFEVSVEVSPDINLRPILQY
jgi:hypothetical protein